MNSSPLSRCPRALRCVGGLLSLLLFAVGIDATLRSATSGEAFPAGCKEQAPCLIGERGYHVKFPDDWDGVSKLPVLLHFHGWKRQGTLIVRHRRIAGATRQSGVLLLAPNGLRGSWDFWDADSADVDFARAVLADAAKRWPIDEDRIFVSGYSYGSAMAWRFACQEGDRVAQVLAVSGTLPSQYEDCPTGPVAVRHVHGTSDRVMDFPFGPKGEHTYPVTLWWEKNGCGDAPDSVDQWAVTERDAFTRYTWTNCTSGKPVTLDVHSRGHFIPVGWIQRQLDEILGLDPQERS